MAILVLLVMFTSQCSHRASGIPDELEGRVQRFSVHETTLYTVRVTDRRQRNSPTNIRLLLHGGPGLDHTYMRPWLDPLGKTGQAIYVDLRGHGRSSMPSDGSGYTLASCARDLDGLVEQLSHDNPVDVVAHDFGAAVAIEFAARYPERIRRLVLIDPLSKASQLRLWPRRARGVLGPTGFARLSALGEPVNLRTTAQWQQRFTALGALWWHQIPDRTVIERMARDLRYSAIAESAFSREIGTWDSFTAAEEVRCPTLVISGSHDRLFTPEESRRLADILPHGRYVSVQNSGHFPFIERREETLDVIDRFLQGQDRVLRIGNKVASRTGRRL